MSESQFKLITKMKPCGDQPKAIESLVKGIRAGSKEQVLVGVTGSGKTFTMANVIAQVNKPTLVISHNKTLAAQLYAELKDFFPENAVEYFVSYYDYYQPEAYIPHSDTYIEKDASINDDLDRLRLAATSAVLSRNDCIIVASVSCIYGLGSPEDWKGMLIQLGKGQSFDRDTLINELISLQYERVETELKRGTFRVRGSRIDIFPSYGENPHRIETDGEQITRLLLLDRVHFRELKELERLALYPAKHFVTPPDRLEAGIQAIKEELTERIKELTLQGKDLEAKRIESRTLYDLEMLREVGYCSGVENYSRHLSGRPPGASPDCLIDYFPKDFLLMIDESHQTVSQIRGMYNGDYSRKKTLVEHGFRLPSALDNRPLKFPEFERKIAQVVYVSATPGRYEMERADAKVEQIIRPTGLLDPEIEVRKSEGQIDDLIAEIKKRQKVKERVLITTLTKKMAEDLSRYLRELGLRGHYLHSEFDAFERVEILQDLRQEKYDYVIGVNLLREGLDLPEVSLVIILDADKEGFLRSDVSLIQTAGRAARHIHGKVIMYADRVTDSMRRAMDETDRRRKLQEAFNRKYQITPKTVQKEIREGIQKYRAAEKFVSETVGEEVGDRKLKDYIVFLQGKMEGAARALEFNKAAYYRDQIRKLESEGRLTGENAPSQQPINKKSASFKRRQSRSGKRR